MSGGFVRAIGTREEAAATLPANAVIHRAPGTIVPGLIDSHLHMLWTGLKLLRIFGERSVPVADALAALDADGFNEPWPGGSPTLQQRLAALRVVQPVLHSLGITGVVDPAVTAPELSAYAESRRRGELSTRVVAMPLVDLAGGVAGAVRNLGALGVRTGFGDEWLRLGAAKVFLDGEGADGTALRREPWPDRHGVEGRGWQRMTVDDLWSIASSCAQSRWSLGVHVVGGGAIDAALETFTRVNAATPISELGFTLIHAYLEPSKQNMRSAAELGVMVAAQPAIHWINGSGLIQRLGPSAETANPIRAWLEAGVTVGGGSDGPFFPIDPRLGMWQARTRLVRGVQTAHAPELGLDAQSALSIYTTGAAAVSLAGSWRGCLREGFTADWTALEADPLTATADEIRRMSMPEIAIGGRIIG